MRSRLASAVGATIVGCAIALLSSQPVLAARVFPENSRQVKITAAADDTVIADGDALHLAPGVVIFTTTNATVVRGALPTPVFARVQVDLRGDVRKIWLLADDEILVRPWWQFWKSEQRQSDPSP